ncbi:helix-turn-helix domain-containing protein [Streptomyces sp. NBC_00378]|uniref:helix-turn-helix transcriptional regulator n=1 Tax=unclassified Streptomyces TaxID=2593676 RepID=UPI00224DC79B|nr:MULTISPECIES: helix-turn-helix domain-containing protein [unclassified Streptomyces]MCX5115526.1 helix-turn-helix domain-containing protein [Streptomyces sp. NBC_00378]
MTRGLADFDPAALLAFRTSHMGVDQDGKVWAVPLTAAALAARVGTTKAQILAYENGHQTPDPKRIRELADALDVDPQMLMNQKRRKNWDLADIRRASGLTARDVVEALGISPKSYRRFEQHGIVPARRPKFLDDVTDALGVAQRDLHAAIDNVPAVRERRRQTAVLTETLADRYVARPGTWKGPNIDDPCVLQLSALYGRPPQRIRRLMTHLLGELRQMSVRMQREKIIADFDPEPMRQQRAWAAIERWGEVYDQEIDRIPRLLEGFHRAAQPSDAWQVLVNLHDAGTQPDGSWVFSALLGSSETLRLLPRSLARQQTFNEVAAAQLTPSGHMHVRSFQELYAALYPGLRRPRPQVSRHPQGANRAARPEAAFTLPGRQERFVIPHYVLDELLLAGKSSLELTVAPNLRFTFGLNGSSVTSSGPTRP